MGVRDSVSRLTKKVRRLGSKHKPGRAGADSDGGSVDPVDPLLRPEPQVVAGDGGGNISEAGGRQAYSTDQPLQPNEPELVPAGRSEDGQGEREAGIDEGGVGQRHSHIHSDVEVGVGSGPGREGSEGPDSA